MKKVIILGDFTVNIFPGGSEMNVRSLADFANESKLLDVEEISLNEKDGDKFKRIELLKEKLKAADLVILNNRGTLQSSEITWLINNVDYVNFEQDYSFCKNRNYMCEQGGCKCQPEIAGEIIKKAKLNVFLNPLQRQIFKSKYGDCVNNSILVPAIFDSDPFHDMKLKRIPNSHLMVGRLNYEKGVDRVMNMAMRDPNGKYFFVGEGNETGLIRLPNVIHLGKVDFKTLPYLYNLMENYVCLSNWVDTGPRTVVEAELSGCKIICDDSRCGIRSYKWNSEEELRELIKNAPNKFWEKVMEVMK